MPVAELHDRVGWPEFLHWIEFYTWEAEQQVPKEKRVIRTMTAEDAVAALDRIAKPRLNDAATMQRKGRRRGK